MVTERTATSITLTWDSGNPEPVSYYIIQHKSKYSEDLFKEIDGVATTRYSVGGLSPYSDYEFRVMAVNNIGRGPPSESIEAKTAEQAPSTAPRQVRGHMMSTTTAVIHWDEPEEANGQIMGYRVYYTSDSTQHVNMWEKQIVRGSNFVTIQGLIPNKTYYIKVLAYTSVGDGPLSADLQIIAKTGGEHFLHCNREDRLVQHSSAFTKALFIESRANLRDDYFFSIVIKKCNKLWSKLLLNIHSLIV